MAHPFGWLQQKQRRIAFAGAFIAAVVLFLVISAWDQPLHTTASPHGIVSFELAGSPSASQAMVNAWGSDARVFAGLSLGIDYLFMVAYALAIGLGCVLVGEALGGRWQAAGAVLAWAQWVAAALDAVENVALIHILTRHIAAPPWPGLAAGCAAVKFILVAQGIAFIVLGAGALGKRLWFKGPLSAS